MTESPSNPMSCGGRSLLRPDDETVAAGCHQRIELRVPYGPSQRQWQCAARQTSHVAWPASPSALVACGVRPFGRRVSGCARSTSPSPRCAPTHLRLQRFLSRGVCLLLSGSLQYTAVRHYSINLKEPRDRGHYHMTQDDQTRQHDLLHQHQLQHHGLPAQAP
jgi:hypothetical protein